MQLSSDILSQFAKVTKDETTTKQESIVYGTIIESNGEKYVQLDGSDLLTPMASTTNMSDGERVTVMIKNHMAVVTGNVTSPAVRDGDVDDKVSDVKKLVVEDLKATNAEIENLKAQNAEIENLVAGKITVEQLKAVRAEIDELIAKKADIEHLNATNAEIENLKAQNAEIENLVAGKITVEQLEAVRAEIDELIAKKADIEHLNATYANIDFANISKVAMEYFYATSGLIKDVVIDNGTITGNLVGVTIKGDLIEGNTVVAEKLVIKGNDGLYYKLNTDGMKVEAEQTDYNSLNGSIITAKSITATKISVSDLVAFDATIGGFNITDSAIYSGVKESVDNTTRGIYLDKTGQFTFGDSNNFLKFYKDSNGAYKLEISAASIKMGTSGTNVETAINNVKDSVDNIQIGGRNLLAKTDILYERTNASSGIANYQVQLVDGYDMQSLIGKTVTASLYLHSPGNRASETPDDAVMRDRFGAHMTVRWLDSTGQNSMAVAYPCTDLLALDRTRSRVSSTTTLTPPSGYDTLGLVSMSIQLYAKPASDNPETWQIGYPKLELGNKATDWSPAPEDAEQKIADLSAEMVLQAGQISFNASAIEEVQSSYHGIKPASGTIVQADGLLAGQGIQAGSRIDPIQTGSGDPYPAGGGKNLTPSMSVDTKTSNGVTFTKQSDGSVVVNGTATGYASAASVTIDASALRGKTLTIKGSNVANIVAQMALQCDSGIVYKSATASNSKLLTFIMPDDANTMRWEVYVLNNTSANNVVVYPQLELGSESTEYALYSNIRPIAGRTGAMLTRCGKNLLNPEPSIQSGQHGIVFTPIAGGQGVHLKGTSTAMWAQTASQYYNTIMLPPGRYTLSQKKVGETGGAAIGVAIQFNGKNAITTASSTYTFTLSEHTKVGWFVYVEQSGVTVDCSVYHQLEAGAVATDYEPYQDDTFTADFGQIIYGGTLNWNTGELTVDRTMLALDGTEAWSANLDGENGKPNRFHLTLAGYETGTHPVIADRYKTVEWSAHGFVANSVVLYRDAHWANTRLSIASNLNEDEWKSYLAEQHAAGTPVQVCYELAEPYTIQLPPQDIIALVGLNTVYTDLDWNDVEFGHESRSGLGAASGYEMGQVTKRVTTAEVNIDALEGAIVNKVEKTEFDKLGNRLSNAEGSITTQAGQITSNATKIETVSQAAGKAQDAANAAQNAANNAQNTASGAVTRVTVAEQKISAVEASITSKVSQTEFDKLGQTVSQHSTIISQTAEKIESKAEKSAVDALSQTVSRHESTISQTPEDIRMAVENVQIGGRNYILGTGTPYTAVGNGSRQWLYPWKCASIEAANSLFGKTVTISFDYDAAITSGSLLVQTNILWWGVKSFGVGTESSHFTLTRKYDAATMNDDAFIYIDGTWTGSVTFRNLKVEIGNKATDWSPAPEDTDAAIAELSAAITLQAGEITSNATKIETVSQAAGKAQSSANAAQNTANAAQNAASGAQNTANAAQNAANSAQSTANGAVTRVTSAEQRISAAESAITSKVSRTEFDALGNTVSEMGTEIRQNEEEILLLAGKKSGGTQLLKNGGFYGGLSNWSKMEYNVNGEWRNLYVEAPTPDNQYRSREAPNLILHAQYETGMFGAAQVVNGLRKNTQYTISGYVASHRCNRAGIEIRDTTASRWAMNPVFDVGWGGTNLSAYNRFEYTFDTGDYTDYQITLYSNNFQDNAYVWWAQIKLEEGNTATAWSPHPDDPASSVDAGGVVRVDQTGVHMSGGTIEMETTDGDEYIHIRNDGISASSLSAPNVAKRYSGPTGLYVNPNATSAQIAAGNYFRSISDALATINNRMLDYNVFVNMSSGMSDYADAVISGVYGDGSILIYGENATIYGTVTVRNSHAQVHISQLHVAIPSGVEHAAYDVRNAFLTAYTCTMSGNNKAFHVETNGYLDARSCVFRVNAEYSAYVLRSTASFENCIGNGALICHRANMTAYGNVPIGGASYWESCMPNNISGLVPTAADGTPAAPVISTATYNYTSSDSYRGGWSYFDTDAPRQGFNGMDIYGTIWFDAAAIRSALSGKTIKQASLRLFMVKGVGRGRSVVVQLHGTNMGYDGRSGRPELTTSYGTIGTTEPDMNNEMTIPTAVIDDIVSGKIQALVLKSDDTVEYKDKFYSENYARFEGSTSNTTADNCPRLTVVYQ